LTQPWTAGWPAARSARRAFRGHPAGRRTRPRWASRPRRESRPCRAAAHHLRAGRAPSRLPRPAGCTPDRAVCPPPRHPHTAGHRSRHPGRSTPPPSSTRYASWPPIRPPQTSFWSRWPTGYHWPATTSPNGPPNSPV